MPQEIEEIKELLTDQHRKATEATDALKAAHEELDGRIGKIDDELKQRGKETVEVKESYQNAVEKITQLEEDQQAIAEKIAGIKQGGSAKKETFGQLVVKNGKHKEFQGSSMELFDSEKALTTDGDPATVTDLVFPQQIETPVMLPQQPLFLRSLLRTVPTSSDTINWVQMKSRTNNADYQLAQGDTKAESEFDFEPKTTNVVTIAHFIKVSRQALADARTLAGLIDTELRYGLALKEEVELLTSAGTTDGTLTGIIPQATSYNNTLNVTGDTAVDKLRRAILQGTQALFPLDTFVLSNKDWCDIELLKTDDNAYLFTNPVTGTSPRLWGKRVIESHGIAEDTFLSAGFLMGATLWDREKVTVRASEHDGDNFKQNMVTVLCEERIALTVERPAAFITGTISTAP